MNALSYLLKQASNAYGSYSESEPADDSGYALQDLEQPATAHVTVHSGYKGRQSTNKAEKLTPAGQLRPAQAHIDRDQYSGRASSSASSDGAGPELLWRGGSRSDSLEGNPGDQAAAVLPLPAPALQAAAQQKQQQSTQQQSHGNLSPAQTPPIRQPPQQMKQSAVCNYQPQQWASPSKHALPSAPHPQLGAAGREVHPVQQADIKYQAVLPGGDQTSASHHNPAANQTWGRPIAAVGITPRGHSLRPPAVQQQQQQPQQQQAAAPYASIGFHELSIHDQIGQGGFGKVYLGLLHGQPVAVKVLSTEHGSRSNLVQEFRREVETMTTVPAHPNLLRLVGVCIAPPQYALVTEHCEHGSLYALLHSQAALPYGTIIQMLLDVARGVAHLHAHRVLHRDLKSSNILIGRDGRVRVADFGLSKLYVDHNTMTCGMGTYQWMAPEVLANQRYSDKADIYGFAIVVWECVARALPYNGMNGMQAALAVMTRGLRPTIPTSPPRPAKLVQLIKDCWNAIPERRPNVVQVVERLTEMLSEHTLGAPAPG